MKKFILIMILLSCMILTINAQAIPVRANDLQGDIKLRTDRSYNAPVLDQMTEATQSNSIRNTRNLYEEGFEGTTGFALPAGWTKEGGQGTEGWRTINSTDLLEGFTGGTWPPRTGARSLVRSWAYASPSNWLFSTPIALEAGQVVQVEFYFKGPGYQGETDDFELRMGPTATSAGMASAPVLFSFVNQEAANWTLAAGSYTAPSTGNYYLAFHDLSPVQNGFFIQIDDIVVFEVEASDFPPITNLSANGGDRYVNLSWTVPAPAGATLLGYRVYRNGVAVNATLVPAAATTYTDTPLVNGVPFEYYIIAHYSTPVGQSDPSETVIGTPDGPAIFPFPPTNLTGSSEPGTAFLSWEPPIYEEPGEWLTHARAQASTGYIWVGEDTPWSGQIAHRWTAAMLNEMGLIGMPINSIGFYPQEAPATYRVRLWTGGSTNNPGTMVRDILVSNFEVRTWNDIVLDDPVYIQPNQEIWIGLSFNFSGGGHSGVTHDALNQPTTFLDGFGNMFYFNNSWTTLYTVLSTAPYHWMLRGFISHLDRGEEINLYDYTMEYNNLTKEEEQIYQSNLTFSSAESDHPIIDPPSTRNLLGYFVYRGNQSLTPDPIYELTFTDTDVPDIEPTPHVYRVTAFYDTLTESEPIEISLRVPPIVIIVPPHEEGFEAASFPPVGWGLVDQSTEGPTDNWMRLVQGGQAHTPPSCAYSRSGQGTVAYFPDNWLLTPIFDLTSFTPDQGMTLEYYVGTTTAAQPVENYSVLVSTNRFDMDSFVEIFTEVTTTNAWQQRIIDLSAYCGQEIVIAFRHFDSSIVGTRALKIDTFYIHPGVSEKDPTVPVLATALIGNYPNPFNPETTIKFSVAKETFVELDIFNIKGQKVTTLVNDFVKAGNREVVWNGNDDSDRPVSSGIYFYRLRADNDTSVKRMILMK